MAGGASTDSNASASTGQATTHAGSSPSANRWSQKVHFSITPVDSVESRRVVRADPGAVAATDAAVPVDEDGAGGGVLGVGVRGAPLHAGRIKTVVAGQRVVEDRRVRQPLPVEGGDRCATRCRRWGSFRWCTRRRTRRNPCSDRGRERIRAASPEPLHLDRVVVKGGTVPHVGLAGSRQPVDAATLRQPPPVVDHHATRPQAVVDGLPRSRRCRGR